RTGALAGERSTSALNWVGSATRATSGPVFQPWRTGYTLLVSQSSHVCGVNSSLGRWTREGYAPARAEKFASGDPALPFPAQPLRSDPDSVHSNPPSDIVRHRVDTRLDGLLGL